MKTYQQIVYAIAACLLFAALFAFGGVNKCHADEVRIGSSAHYISNEAALPTPATAGPVDCDIQSPTFHACLSAHAGELVNLGDIKPARRVQIDADGTVHLLAK